MVTIECLWDEKAGDPILTGDGVDSTVIFSYVQLRMTMTMVWIIIVWIINVTIVIVCG